MLCIHKVCVRNSAGLKTLSRVDERDSPVHVVDVGGTIDVAWTGPGYRQDYIAIATIGAEGKAYETYRYTRRGNPSKVKLPETPGSYEIRYVTGRDRGVLARATIIVE